VRGTLQQAVDDRLRYFIVSPGRTGSTLLAWVLAKAGADFGVELPEAWDPRAGELEHPELIDAARAFGAAHQLSPEKPRTVGYRLPWTWCRHKGKHGLKRVLPQARFLKAEDLDLAVQPAFKLGYMPRIILSYRRFEPHVVSRFQRQTYASIDWLEAYYLRVCRNALLQIQLYGGCSIDYDDLMNPSADSWAEALEACTGFPAEKLTQYRNVATAGRDGDTAAQPKIQLSEQAEAVYRQMRDLTTEAVAPSRQARRNWAAKHVSVGVHAPR
jgi:hypothetical protein